MNRLTVQPLANLKDITAVVLSTVHTGFEMHNIVEAHLVLKKVLSFTVGDNFVGNQQVSRLTLQSTALFITSESAFTYRQFWQYSPLTY